MVAVCYLVFAIEMIAASQLQSAALLQLLAADVRLLLAVVDVQLLLAVVVVQLLLAVAVVPAVDQLLQLVAQHAVVLSMVGLFMKVLLQFKLLLRQCLMLLLMLHPLLRLQRLLYMTKTT